MSSFVLVHGGAHGAWCWNRVIPHLEADARVDSVLAVDLCGHGARSEAKPAAEIELADYVANVVEDVEAADLRDIVLVGHSMAGITIPVVAWRIPERIGRLVYLSTTTPAAGESVMDSMKHPLSPMSRGIELTEGFCSDLDDEAKAWLLSRLVPEPPGPLSEAVEITRGPAEIPATYVVFERDQVLPPAYQREQAENLGLDDVVSFEAGHSAFASRPADLASLLLRYA